MTSQEMSARVRAGIAARQARGLRHGRPPSMDPAQIPAALAMYEAGEVPVARIADAFGVTRPALYAAFKRADPEWVPGRR